MTLAPSPPPLLRPALIRWARRVWQHKWRVLALLLALVGGALAVVRWQIGPQVVATPVLRGELVKSVVASGHVETPFRVDIGSQITGTVREVLVEEGEAVTRGQPLIALDPTELQGEVVHAQGAVAEAEAKVRQMAEVTLPAAQETLKQAQANLVNAQAAFGRAQELAKGGFGTQATLDDATKTQNVMQTQVRAAQLQVYTMSPGGSDYVVAQTQLSQAQANLATATARLGYATITAPRDGVLISRSVERGSVVQAGKTLLVLAPAGDLQLVVQIDEKNLSLLKVGQDALGSADAYPDQRFPARLVYINPSVDITRASVQVKLLVPNPPAYLRQDMTVSVDIAVDRRPDALVIPARMVEAADGPAPFVLVVHDGRAERRPVRLGLRAGDRIQVLDGLSAGELVLAPGSGARAGGRVRVVAP